MEYCPSCQTNLAKPADVCPKCGYKSQAPNGKTGPSIAKSAIRPKIQCRMEMAVTVDRTGSDQENETGIPKILEMTFGNLTAKARDIKVWLASHGDLDFGEKFIIHTDGGTPDQAMEDLKKIRYAGGFDPEESHLDAIETLHNSVPWTADPSRARGAIMAFMTADTKPTKSGITAAELGRRIHDQRILLYLVREPTPTLQELADAAQGLVFKISDNPDPNEFQKIDAELARSILATVGSGSTIPLIN